MSRRYRSFLRARLRMAGGIGSLLLNLFQNRTVRQLQFALLFGYGAIGATMLTFMGPLVQERQVQRWQVQRRQLEMSFLRARLRMAGGISSLLLALFQNKAVRQLPFAFLLGYGAIGAAMLAFMHMTTRKNG